MTARKQVNLSIDPKVHAKLQTMANVAGMSLSAYATLLFEATYAARCKETGDIDLDMAVGRVALLFGSGFNAISIRKATGLSETFVARAVDAWQSQMRSRPATAEVRVA